MPRKTALPQWIAPQLTQLVTAAPSGEQWLHEIKLDGYRMAVRIDKRRARLLTRTGLDWTAKYPAAIEALSKIKADAAYLDGELCGIGEAGYRASP
jgi:ATP-dependent DNA ligase